MITNADRVNIFNRRILGVLALSTQLRDYLEEGGQRHLKAMTTGPTPDDDPGAWFSPVTMDDGGGSNQLTFGDMYGTDGAGNFISEDAGGDYITDVPFTDTAATTYYVAATHGLVPVEMAENLSDGTPEYDYHAFKVAQVAAPSAVVVNGGGLDFTLGNHKLHASDDFTGRTCVIWKVDPESNSNATAIETVVIVGTTATSAGDFGQTSPSTTAADYRVAILGPVITRSSSVQSLAGYAFIGTVVGGGAPRVFNDSGQTLLNTLGEVSSVFDGLLSKGWTSLPSVSGTGTGTLTNGTGTAYSNGRLHAVAGGTNGSLAISSTLFASYDISSGAVSIYTSWDNANNGDRVPLAVLVTNGAGVITKLYNVGVLVREFNRPIALTLSTDTAQRSAFTSLPEVLAVMASIQSGSTLTSPGFLVDVVGDVTVAATISDQTLLTAQRVTFRGRGSRWEGAGSRFVWTFDDSLFKVTSGTMKGWTFEDLSFVADVTMTDATDAIVQVTGTGTLTDLRFRRCFVDGAPSLSGGAGGSLPQVVFNSSANSISGLQFIECEVYTTDAIVQTAHASGDLQKLRIQGGRMSVDASAAIGAALGAVVSIATGGADWWINGVEFDLTEAPCLSVYALIRCHLFDCDVNVIDADVCALDIGYHAGFTYTVADLFIHDNRIKRNYASGVASSPVVRIRAMNQSSQPSGIFIHSNRIEGDTGGSDVGIYIASGTTDLEGVIIHSNLIPNCDAGVVFEALDAGAPKGSIVHANAIHARVVGVEFTDTVQPLAVGNYVAIVEAAGIGFDVNESALLLGNVANMADATGVGVDVAAAAVETLIVGNRVLGSTGTPFLINGADRCLIVGNVSTDTGGELQIEANSPNTVVLGNVLDEIDLNSASCLVVGNHVENGIIFGGSNSSFVGNWLSGISADATGYDRIIMVGNHARGLSPGDQGAHHVVVGNWISADASYTFDATDSAVVGNVIESAAIALGSNSVDVALVGNYLADGTVTDNGTTNVIASNADT